MYIVLYFRNTDKERNDMKTLNVQYRLRIYTLLVHIGRIKLYYYYFIILLIL